MDSKPNPQNNIYFPEENFMDFKVQHQDQTYKLHTYRYQPKSQPKALIILFHGLCAHMNHGAHLAHHFSEIGCVTVGFDFKGFGKSQGERGYISSFHQHMQDCRQFYQEITKIYPNLPIFLAGLSLGGLTVFKLALELSDQIKGVILFAPAIKLAQPKILVKVANFLGSIMPTWRVIFRKKGLVTKNPQVQLDMQADPYNYKENLQPGTIKSLYEGVQMAEQMYSKLIVPWILIQGAKDKLVNVCLKKNTYPELAKLLEQQSESKDKTVLYYEELWHDIWHEEEIHEIIPKVKQWIEIRYESKEGQQNIEYVQQQVYQG